MGQQAPEIPAQLSEEPHKFLPQEVASTDWTLDGHYQVPFLKQEMGRGDQLLPNSKVMACRGQG